MRKERELELLDRIESAGERRRGLFGETSTIAEAAAYVDPDRFAIEQSVLFREGPVFFAMSADLREPGSWRSMRFDGIPIVVVRQADGSLRALVNICRHRGSPLVDPQASGDGLRAFSCPYHAWTYELDGKLRARPGAADAFDDVTMDCNLVTRAVAEKHGLIFVRPGGTEPIDVDAALGGAEDDLGAFGLADYTLVGSRTSVREFNWKFLFDTFTETYHIRTLHRSTLGNRFHPESIFEPFERNLLLIGVRTDVDDEFAKPRADRTILPYGTIQYFLVPSGLIVHQLDHVEVWNIEPLSVDRTRLTTSVYAPSEPESDRQRDYFLKNLDLLLEVTGTEDFPLVEQIQRNLASGAMDRLVYGKIEPALGHFHQSVNDAIAHEVTTA
ncbi:MAG: aromatic ring-hydroxylating dioxygenase subunit alpha [Actinomycetota bacterium]